MKFNTTYIYYMLLIGTFLAFIFASEDVTEVPTWGTALGVMLLGYAAGDQSWKALKRQGRASILTSLGPTEGGHSTIHPDDIRMAINRSDSNLPNLMVFVTGGFVHSGLEWKGSENFVVCTPEHCESTGPAFICHSFLRQVEYERLPDYVQSELTKLKEFNITPLKDRRIWFGMTSKRDGTATTKNLELESKFLDQTHVINHYKTLLKDKPSTSKKEKSSNQYVVNIPE